MSDEPGCFFIFWAMIAAVVWFAWLGDSELRYNVQYNGEVTYQDKPHDCDFLTAPLGIKNCSYEKEVSIFRFSIDIKGEPIISYDDGETWHWNKDGPTNGKGVRVYWVRIRD